MPALAVAQRWHGLGADAVLSGMASLVDDMSRIVLGVKVVKHHDLAPIIQGACRHVSAGALLGFRQGLSEKQRFLSGNIQGSLLLDTVFSEWGRMS